MPPVSVAYAMAERDYLRWASIETKKEDLEKRIEPVFSVFTQHLKPKHREETKKKVLDSIFVIDEYKRYGPIQGVGLGFSPSAYKRVNGAIEVSEFNFNKLGYLEWAMLLKLGDMDWPIPIIKNPVLAANAVVSFYLKNYENFGLPTKEDDRSLWWAKYIIPTEFQGEKIEKISYKHGNLARVLEKEKKGSGLEYIYNLGNNKPTQNKAKMT